MIVLVCCPFSFLPLPSAPKNIKWHRLNDTDALQFQENTVPFDSILYVNGFDHDLLTQLLINNSAQLFSNTNKKLWIHSLWAGVNGLCTALKSSTLPIDKILLTNGKGAYDIALAEWVIASSFYFLKRIPRLLNNKKTKTWERFQMNNLRGKTMGFLGFGSIAQECAKHAIAFGVKVIALKRSLKPLKKNARELLTSLYVLERDGENGTKMLLENSDILVSTLPGTKETENFLSAKEWSLCKSGTIFISIGRGTVVDENALYDALVKTEKLRGAALDVFQKEPLSKLSPLWNVPEEKMLISSHNADFSQDYYSCGFTVFEENYERLYSSKEEKKEEENGLTIVDIAKGY